MDRNIVLPPPILLPVSSLSARRAWIEIGCSARNSLLYTVALRKESVDRNRDNEMALQEGMVALRKESVDRNQRVKKQLIAYRVALRKESVDRNAGNALRHAHQGVALRKESVDRNRAVSNSLVIKLPSLSARRAWIEIC